MADKLPPLQYKALADALLPMADRLVPQWLSGGVQRGHEWVCGSLAGGKGTSCSVNLVTGAWADFSGDVKGGDLLGLYAAIHGLAMARACVELARAHGLEDVAGVVMTADGAPQPVRAPRPPPEPAKAAPAREGWRAIAPVPGYAPPVTYQHQHRTADDIVHVSEYWCEGQLYGYVVRFKTSDGGKDDIARTWCESVTRGGARWHWKQWEEPRPLYLPGRTLPKGRTAVLVEGERKGDVLQQLLDAHAPGVYCVVGWPGGCKAWAKADWSWLAGSTVLLWPDCDSKREQPGVKERKALPEGDAEALRALKESKPYLPYLEQPGMKAQRAIGALLRDAHGCTVSLLPIEQPGVLPDGWDAKDAIEVDGWTGERVLAFFGQAVTLVDAPAQAAGAAAGAPAAKKTDSPVGTPGAVSADAEGEDDDGLVKCGARLVPAWLAWYYDAKARRWAVSRKTVIAALERAPQLQGVLAYDELRNSVACRKAFPWAYSKPGEIRGADALALGKWMSDEWGLPSISKASLEEGIQTVAHANRYHPVREWLGGLRWDGKRRLDKWLMHVLGEAPDTVRPAMAEYLCLVGRYWLLGMVYRVMEPGCKFDYCPVLEGLGGLRKSTLVEVLAGSDYYSDTPFQVGQGKEGPEQVQGCWLYEIAELTHFSKAEVGAIKAFISSKVDRYRVAYGSTVESFPRQCVLVGTTNEDTYLRDRTGNRRFWPIPVRGVINTDWVAKYREQLLAEAYALYLQGERYTPTTDEEARLFQPMQESRLVETAVESELLAVLTRKPNPNASGPLSFVHCEAPFVTIAQLVQALGVDAAKAPPGLQGQVTAWLKHEGWERVKKQVNGVRAWGFQRPAVWPPKDRATGLDQQDGPPGDDLPDGGPAPAPVAPQPPLSPAAAYLAEADDAPF
ncbi:VapE domain-containing protein [Melaminivora sp.]|uniref:VapE domain-containing protein n=1 Tax=Melaminivora sp. TaxID=1933032 RepID=UPI0028AA4F14|nr:VapE domain-containing protein [Melaminivora sp.]